MARLHRQEDIDEIAVYDGMTCIGTLIPRDRARAYDAFGIDGTALGRFVKPDAAARAIYLAHHGRRSAA